MSDGIIPDSLKHIAYGYDSLKHEQRENLLQEMQRDVYDNNVAHGWFDTDRTVGEEVALLHEEASEILRAWRKHGFDDYEDPEKPGSPEGAQYEAADVLIRLLDFCERHDVDLAEAYRVKMNYNLTRPYRHGGRRI